MEPQKYMFQMKEQGIKSRDYLTNEEEMGAFLKWSSEAVKEKRHEPLMSAMKEESSLFTPETQKGNKGTLQATVCPEA